MESGQQRTHYLNRKRRPHGSVKTRARTFTIPETTLERLADFVETPQAEGLSESYHVGEAIDKYVSARRRALGPTVE